MILKAISGPFCDRAGCERDWDIRLEENATLLNPGKSVKLCDTDWSEWLAEESELRNRIHGPNHMQSAHHKRRT